MHHDAFLSKIDASPTRKRQIKAWLKAGVRDKGERFPTDAGTPQGGGASPLVAHIALHGLEQSLHAAFPGPSKSPALMRYADDLVVLHPDRQVIDKCQEILTERLNGMGLELQPSKTRMTHTLTQEEGEAGCNVLGVNIRQ